MNILHLTHGIYFGNGLESFLESLTNGIKEHKHYISCHKDRFDKRVKLNAEFIGLDSLEQIPEIIDKYDIDILHLHWTGAESFSHDSLIADIPFLDENKNFIKDNDGQLKTQKAIISKKPNQKLTIDDEQYGYMNWKGDSKTKVIITSHSLEPIPSFLNDNYDYCISVSKKCYEVQQHLRCTHEIIYNGVDYNKFVPKKIKVGLAGRVDKFDHNLLKNLSLNDFIKQHYEFIFAGGNHELYVNKYPNNFKFLGNVEDMVNFYHSIDLLFHPSLSDSFGLVLVEAMACNLDVIVPEEIAKNIEYKSNDFIYSDLYSCLNIFTSRNLISKFENIMNNSYVTATRCYQRLRIKAKQKFSHIAMCKNYNKVYYTVK